MKQIVIFCIFCLSSIACCGQQIRINTEFTLSLKSSSDGKYSYEITESKAFDGTLDMMNNNVLEDKVKEGEIKGIFTYVTMMGQNKKPYLVIKSGISEQLKCKLTVSKSNTFLAKSELDIFLLPNVKRGDIWQDDIDQIKISDFISNEPVAFEIIENIDSTCINGKGLNPQRANKILAEQIAVINNKITDDKGLSLIEMVNFEQQINSQVITHTYTQGIAESMYPNQNKYVLNERPKNFKRVECPYLSNEIIYFSEVDTDLIRVFLFEWNEFNERDLIFYDGMGAEMREKVFREKFTALEKIISKVLGKPYQKDFESTQSPERFFDNIFWKSKKGLYAKLSLFGQGDDNLRYIYLTIYYN